VPLLLSAVAIVDRRLCGCNTLDPPAVRADPGRLHGRDFADPALVGIDFQPYDTTQAPERSDILNVGGFSDTVFSVVAASFPADDNGRFVAEVEAVELW
jgi:60 kDa SS-A/Ro ribonucleoprotein